MIQRIQSIFLLLAALCFGAFFIFPFASSEESIGNMLADQVYNIQDHVLMIALVALGIVVTVTSIFTYKNRALQVRLAYGSLVLGILLCILAVFLFMTDTGNLEQGAELTSSIQDQVGAYLPLGLFLFIILAIRYIRKDEKLVSSMDRLR